MSVRGKEALALWRDWWTANNWNPEYAGERCDYLDQHEEVRCFFCDEFMFSGERFHKDDCIWSRIQTLMVEYGIYRCMSQDGCLDRFLRDDSYSFEEWFRREFKACLSIIAWRAEQDDVKAESWVYDVEFHHQRWDFHFAVVARPLA